MSASTLKTGTIVIAIGAALFGHVAVAAAQQPTSVLELFNRIPKTPATIQEADKLVDWNGKSSSTGTAGSVPAVAALKADIDAHAAAVGAIVGAANAKIQARMGMPSTPEQAAQGAAKGAAAAGIDVARMQKDPAYAKEMQAKMKAMSPAELMAMSMAMQQGMGMRGSVAVYDPPAVKAAAEAGEALMLPDQQAARTATYQRRWVEVAKKVAAVDARFAAKYPKRPSGCDGEGGGTKECIAAANQYIAAMMPLLYAHDAEVLQLEAAALEEERAALAKEVRTAEPHLLAAQYGALSQELGNPGHILSLDGYIASAIEMLAIKFEEIVKRAALVTHCGSKYLGSAGGCYAQQ